MTVPESTPRCLLLIDDDAACRTTIAFLLQRLGHTVTAAENGSVGLTILRQMPVDVVMTDLNMPGLTGWDVARLAKAMRPRLPVVLVTGCAHAISPDQLELQFVDAILPKPFGVAAMQAVIGALTRDLSGTVCADGSESPWLTQGRGGPTTFPVPGNGSDAPVDVRGIPMDGDASASTRLAA